MTTTIAFAIAAIVLALVLFYAFNAAFKSRARTKGFGVLLLALIALTIAAWFFAPRLFPSSDPPKYDRWINES